MWLNLPIDGKVCPRSDYPVREDLLLRSELPKDAVSPLLLELAVRVGEAEAPVGITRVEALVDRANHCS